MVDRTDVKEFIQSLIIAGILAFFIITFVAQSFVVDGASMEPTLHDGERLFVNKFIYRFHPPERDDIIVFTPHGRPGVKFIKRVIGLPGETVRVYNGKTYVDGKPLSENFINEPMDSYRNFGPERVPENKVFVMGDNRNKSTDSRIKNIVGYVDYSSISGKAFWVYWPLGNMRILKHSEEEIKS
ncbi:MAG: signal peptidase I [Halothermotrichaceae bacterium]